MSTATDLTPIGFQVTPTGMMPCAVCGLPTRGATTAYPVLGRIVETAAGQRSEPVSEGATADLPTCADCRDLDRRASLIVTAHPELRRTLGSVATWRLLTAMYALDALGHALPDPTIAPIRLRALVQRLAEPGARITYSRRFSPIWTASASMKVAARERWSTAGADALAEGRRGYIEWLADARPPRPLPHPTGDQCHWCGTSTVMARRTSEAWFGNLCATCSAVHVNGGLSHEAVWEAIDADRSIRRRTPYRPDLTGVRPWSQAHGGDGTPWSHLGGVDAMRERVAELISEG